MRIRHLKIRVDTPKGPCGTSIDFPDGLVIVWADNSMGKSTCVKSIVVALGLEAMLTTSQSALPLPPCMTERIEIRGEDVPVVGADIYLEIANLEGRAITVHRTVKGTRSKDLVTVFDGPALTMPSADYESRDYFVRLDGAATRDQGFHFFLSGFLGWDLPRVQTHQSRESPLYLECIFPYLCVEQTRGWSSLQPPLPTHFGLREPHKRVVEFLLSLDAYSVAMTRQQLLADKAAIEGKWSEVVSRIGDLVEQVAGVAQALPRSPIASWPPEITPRFAVANGETWISVSECIDSWRDRLRELVESELPRTADVISEVRSELSRVELTVRDKQSLVSRLVDTLDREIAEAADIAKRLSALDVDIDRNKDVRTLQRLAAIADQGITEGRCPVCHQEVPDSLLPLEPGDRVMTVEENLDFLREQKKIFQAVQRTANESVDARRQQIRKLESSLSDDRSRVRELKETLIADGRAPSADAIRERILLETRIAQHASALSKFNSLLGEFEVLASDWASVQGQIADLPRTDLSEQDREKLRKWTEIVQGQLLQYGFRSFPPNEIQISENNYRPEQGGFDLESAFSMSSGATRLEASVSASDMVRTIWAYLYGLLEVRRSFSTNHPGFVVFDEPRQQSTRELSFKALLDRVASAGEFDEQVVFMTSESIDNLNRYLADIEHTLLTFDGHLLKPL